MNNIVKNTVLESYTQWKELNVPKFDIDKFKYSIDKFYPILSELQKNKEILSVKFGWLNNNKDILILFKAPDSAIDENMAFHILEGAKKYMGDGIKEGMMKSLLIIDIVPNSYFETYIRQNMNMNMNGIVNFDYIKIDRRQDGHIRIMFKTVDMMENFSNLLEFFS